VGRTWHGLPTSKELRMSKDENQRTVTIDYTNYRGERATRRIVPVRMDWGKNQYHTKPCWMITALDCDKDEIRTFAIKDIHSWVEGDDNVQPISNDAS